MNTHAMGLLCCTGMLFLSACGQETPTVRKAPQDSTTVLLDTPQADIRVNKQYDEHGNLIAYDSTYTSYFKGRGPLKLDSLFDAFKPGFDKRYPMLMDPGFNDLFFNDSLLHQDFFHDDFFRKRMELNQRYMQRMMAEMDSMKNAYFRNRPPVEPAPPPRLP